MTISRLSITTRLAAMIALILALGGIGVTAAALAYGRQAAEEAYDKLLAGATFEITRSASINSGSVLVDLPVSAFEILALAPEDRVFYRILKNGEETLTGYEELPVPSEVGEEIVFADSEFRGAPVRLAAARRVFAERSFSGEVVVVVAQTLRARTALAWEIARGALAIIGLVGVTLSVLAVFAVRSALRPLRRVEEALARRDPLDLTPLDVSAPPEVGAMVAAIDRFMSRLSRQVGAQRRLLADATHQLRTPIAALRAQAELAVEEQDRDRLSAIVGRIHRRAVGLSRLADQMLNQALIIHRADAAAREPVDLRAVAAAVSEEADHDLFASDATLRLDLPEEPAMVRGDKLSLVEATKNLVSNAMRYGRAPVSIVVRCEPGATSIAVCDQGEGVDAATLAAMRRRVEDGSRRQGGQPSPTEAAEPAPAPNDQATPAGAGIGLSIVGAVAAAHGGALELDRPPGGGFQARLSLPREPSLEPA